RGGFFGGPPRGGRGGPPPPARPGRRTAPGGGRPPKGTPPRGGPPRWGPPGRRGGPPPPAPPGAPAGTPPPPPPPPGARGRARPADDALPANPQPRQDTKASIRVAARADHVPGREGAVGVANRQARHVGAAERVGAPRDSREHRVEVVALGEIAGDVRQGLRLAATALGVGIELGALDRDRGVGAEGRQHLHL